MGEQLMSGNKAGRPKLPPERKKKRKSVVLIQSEIDTLEKRFGSLTLAIRSLIINDTQANNEALETIKQIKELTKNF